MADVRALLASRLFTGEAMLEEHALLIEGGHVVDIVPSTRVPAVVPMERLPEGTLLAPGFIDTQVNGGGGTLLNDEPTVASIAHIAAAHRAFGTTALLPTLITDTRERLREAIAAAAEAIAGGVPGIVGLHLEGPFLNPERRGVHRADLITQMTDEDATLLAEPFPGRLVVTLAPERVPAELLDRLVAAGVLVSIGHTAATYGEAVAGVRGGATGFTHLFNAMTGLASREPGVVGAALDEAGTFAGLIVDGLHVHPASLRAAYAAKGPERLMLVTDAMPSVGTDLAAFDLQGRRIQVRQGRLTAQDGTLAGAHLDMGTAVRNAVALMAVPLESALRMASATPAAFLGLDATHGKLLPGFRADAVALDAGLHPVGTWIGGDRG